MKRIRPQRWASVIKQLSGRWKAGKLDAYQLDTGTVIVRDDTPLAFDGNGNSVRRQSVNGRTKG